MTMCWPQSILFQIDTYSRMQCDIAYIISILNKEILADIIFEYEWSYLFCSTVMPALLTVVIMETQDAFAKEHVWFWRMYYFNNIQVLIHMQVNSNIAHIFLWAAESMWQSGYYTIHDLSRRASQWLHIYIQCIRKVFTALHFFHILLCYSLIPKWIKKIYIIIFFLLEILHTIPHNDNVKKVFEILANLLQIKN